MNLKKLRDSLAVLADNLSPYSEALRVDGFSCCHIDDDWFLQNCREDEIAFHKRYMVEYAREVLASDSPSAILFTDKQNCRSPWLNELKKKRFSELGSENELLKSNNTRHLVELSPCLRELSRVRGSEKDLERTIQSALEYEFVIRRKSELKLHAEEIKSMGLDILSDDTLLQGFYANEVTKALAPFGARKVNTIQMYGAEEVVSFNFFDDLEFTLLPIVSCDSGIDGGFPSGKIGMGYRLTTSSSLRNANFEKSAYLVLNIFVLLPKEFIDYGRFGNPEELCLNILARIAAMKKIVPDVLALLQKNVQTFRYLGSPISRP